MINLIDKELVKQMNEMVKNNYDANELIKKDINNNENKTQIIYNSMCDMIDTIGKDDEKAKNIKDKIVYDLIGIYNDNHMYHQKRDKRYINKSGIRRTLNNIHKFYKVDYYDNENNDEEINDYVNRFVKFLELIDEVVGNNWQIDNYK